MITIEQIKKIATDIKGDKEWVNDSHTFAEHKGVVNGLDRLIQILETNYWLSRENHLRPVK